MKVCPTTVGHIPCTAHKHTRFCHHGATHSLKTPHPPNRGAAAVATVSSPSSFARPPQPMKTPRSRASSTLLPHLVCCTRILLPVAAVLFLSHGARHGTRTRRRASFPRAHAPPLMSTHGRANPSRPPKTHPEPRQTTPRLHPPWSLSILAATARQTPAAFFGACMDRVAAKCYQLYNALKVIKIWSVLDAESCKPWTHVMICGGFFDGYIVPEMAVLCWATPVARIELSLFCMVGD